MEVNAAAINAVKGELPAVLLDSNNGVAYIHLSDRPVAKTEQRGSMVVNLDDAGNVVGVGCTDIRNWFVVVGNSLVKS